MKNKIKSFKVLFLLVLCAGVVIISTQPILADYELGTNLGSVLESKLVGHTEENVIEVYDEDDNYIFASSMGLSVGDRYINEENNEYEVIEVKDKKGKAKFIQKVNLLADETFTITTLRDLNPFFIAQNEEKKIAIYHTHSAESYKPGPVFKSKGEIYDVGEMLKAQLEKRGCKVIQSQDSFLPHDGGAYERSRSTVKQFLQQRPDAIFDIHRDAIPRAEEYTASVAGENLSKVRFVVGRQNPNRKANDQFAKRLKAVCDEKYPGLVKGIFYANGKYNQELSPNCLLLEFGTHVTTKEQAEASTTMMADSIYTMLFGAGTSVGGGKPQTDRAMNSAGWSNLLWIVGIVIVAGGAFLFLNERGLSGVSRRMKEFSGEEFANVLGRLRRRKKAKSPGQRNKDRKKE
ncbi:MAG: stage II sporulation protein P [Halanaerobiales bacterium]|nr:stage II sporulation protein P [Halanaerobiales bacterium]